MLVTLKLAEPNTDAVTAGDGGPHVIMDVIRSRTIYKEWQEDTSTIVSKRSQVDLSPKVVNLILLDMLPFASAGRVPS
jgi:hypothetical protein